MGRTEDQHINGGGMACLVSKGRLNFKLAWTVFSTTQIDWKVKGFARQSLRDGKLGEQD